MRIRGIPLPSFLQLLRPRGAPAELRHVFIAVCDHWEPKWGRPPASVQRERVELWRRQYPRSVEGLEDSLGRPPQHTFFYPQEEYEPEHLDALAELCHAGFGAAEIHLHHDGDTSSGVREKLAQFRDVLYERHGLLAKDDSGRITYGFIHGNWALDNSRPDGQWCGVNDEITILRETGCYADFTMPSAPADCQTSTINGLYYAIDDPRRPKSHDRGVPARVGASPPPEGLLMIQGPLALDWSSRKWGLVPRIENGDLTARRPPTLGRFWRWCGAGVAVQGRPDWIFIKLHTHGAQEANAAMLLGEPMRRFHLELARLSRQSADWKYYYVTAREMADLVHQAERGATEPAIGRQAQQAAAQERERTCLSH
jgi:hypothetical protein